MRVCVCDCVPTRMCGGLVIFAYSPRYLFAHIEHKSANSVYEREHKKRELEYCIHYNLLVLLLSNIACASRKRIHLPFRRDVHSKLHEISCRALFCLLYLHIQTFVVLLFLIYVRLVCARLDAGLPHNELDEMRLCTHCVHRCRSKPFVHSFIPAYFSCIFLHISHTSAGTGTRSQA